MTHIYMCILDSELLWFKLQVIQDELKTKHLLLFISSLDQLLSNGGYNFEIIMMRLKRIHVSFITDPQKSNYRILWIPVVNEWTEENKEKFNSLKSKMPWYIVEYFQPTNGYRVLKDLLLREDPRIMVVDPQGKVLNKSAINIIKFWDEVTAFPYTEEREKQLSKRWSWFWQSMPMGVELRDDWVSTFSFKQIHFSDTQLQIFLIATKI